MSINGRFKDFSRANFFELADRFGIGSAKNVIDEVVTSITSWSSFAAQAGVPKPVADTIGSFHLLELGKV